MRFVRINAGKIGLVLKGGSFEKVLTEGMYWVWPWETVYVSEQGKPLRAPIELDVLLSYPEVAQYLQVLEVNDGEIAIRFKDGKYTGVWGSGKYAFVKGLVENTFIKADLTKIEITEDIDRNILIKAEVMQYARVFVVENYEKGLLMVDGKFEKELGPGLFYFWKNATPIAVLKADKRDKQLENLGQEILTKDKAALRANVFTQYRVKDIQKALLENKDYEKQLYILVQLALREYIGTLTLDELLEKKETISKLSLKGLKEQAKGLGIEVLFTGIKDIILPGDMKEIMNQVLVAQKRAQANTITRREETASTRSLLNTAKLMEDNEMLFRLKEMEYVEKIADKINSISLSGGGLLVDQLRDIFSGPKV